MSKIKSLDDFWQLVVDVWKNGFMGVDIGQIIVAIGIFGLFLIIRGFFARFVLNRLHALTKRTKSDIDDQLIETLDKPLRFVPIVMGLFFAIEYLDFDNKAVVFFDSFIRSLIAFTIFWSLYRALTPISKTMDRLKKVLTSAMVNWIFKAMRVAVIFLGAAVILDIWGIKLGPLLAGLGLFGAAVALGAQDVFKNLIGGLTIIAEKRFHPGDWVKVDGVVEGTVEDIGFRSTQIRRFDKAPVHVPNASLSDAAVTNFSNMTHRRIYWMIGVTYDTTTDQLKTIRDNILDHINFNDAFDKDVTTFVRIDSFNNSSIDIMVYCFTKTKVWGEWLEVKEELAFKIKEIVEKDAKTSFAFPSQSLYIESFPEDMPEIFTPPESGKKSTAKKKES